MIPLMKQMEEVTLELELIVAGDENRIAIDSYKIFFDKFVPEKGKLDNASKNKKILESIPKDYLDQKEDSENGLIIEVGKTIKILDILEEKWKEYDYKVTQDDSFDNTIQSIKALVNNIVDANEAVWYPWTECLLDSFNRTEAELNSIKTIEKYKDRYNTFMQERTYFKTQVKKLPTEINLITDLQELSSRLQTLMQEVNFDIPEEVRVFFDYIDDVVKGKKAPLSLLTPEVLKWIKDNNEISSFSITRTFGNR